MANYSELLNDINAAIYENNDQEIDALEVRAILREMVTSLGSGFLFKGIATPSSPSGTGTYEPDQNVFYLATTAGTYTYLGGLVVAAGEVAFLCFDGTWTKKSSALLSTGSIVDNLTTNDATKPLSAKQGKVLADAGAATAAEVSALGQKVDDVKEESKDFSIWLEGQKKTAKYTDGAFIKTSDDPVVFTPTTNSGYAYARMECQEGETWVIRGQGGGGPRLYCVTDAIGNHLLLAGTNINSSVSTQEIVIPAGAKYIIVNSQIQVEHYAYAKAGEARQSKGSSMGDWISQKESTRLFDFGQSDKRELEFIDGFYIVTNTSVVNPTPVTAGNYSYAVSEVNVGEKFTITGQGGVGPRLYCVTDKDYNVLLVAGTLINASPSTQEIVIPANAKYIIVNSQKAVTHSAFAEAQNDRLIKTDSVVYVAAANSSAFDKICANLVCTGTNDEDTINRAIERLPYGGKVVLLPGDYYVGAFSKSAANMPCAILVGDNGNARYVIIEGVRSTFPNVGRPSRIIVSDACYDSVSAKSVVIGCESDIVGSWRRNAFSVKDLQIELPDCTKPVICISHLHSVYGGCIGVICYNRATKTAWTTATQAPLPNADSVAFYGTNANNSWYYMRYWECAAFGFGTAFKIGGDHITLINCATAKNTYGYTFGTEENMQCSHHITLINCCSESDARYMYFGQYAVPAKEPIVISNFQIEYDSATAPEYTHTKAIEETPGIFCGEITYSAMPNSAFFESGSGVNFKVRNLRSLLRGTTANRPSISNPLEMYFDDTIGKPIWNTGSGWVDASGTSV